MEMLPGDSLLPDGATALEIPSDRPATACHFKSPKEPAVATAVRGLADAFLPDYVLKLYYTCDPDSPVVQYSRRMAYACIIPETAPCQGNPGPFIRRVFRTLALDLPQNFELLPPVYGCKDTPIIFRTPRDREAAMRRQPFQLDGITVKLVSVQIVVNVSNGYMVQLALHDYPMEQRTRIHTTDNCSRFGTVREIDTACLLAPDLSTLRVVLEVEHPREIPRELRIYYHDSSASIIPVEIVRVWERSHSYDANGRYVPLFKRPPETPFSEDEARRCLAILVHSVESGHGSF